jgi:hypothetical protein
MASTECEDNPFDVTNSLRDGLVINLDQVQNGSCPTCFVPAMVLAAAKALGTGDDNDTP